MPAATTNRDLARFLADNGGFPDRRLGEVLEASDLGGVRADTAVLDLGLASESKTLDLLGRFSNSRTVTGAELGSISAEVVNLISPRIARRFGVMPFAREGNTLRVAALDPGDLLIQDELSVMTGCMVVSYAVLEVRLQEALARCYGIDRTPQMVALARRLTSTQCAPATARPTVAEAPPDRTRHHDAPQRTRAAERSAPPVREPRPSELELSDEDLALFPSLREEGPEGELASEATAGDEPPGAADTQPIGQIERRPAEPEADDDARLNQAAVMLQNAEMRDDIADGLLYYCAPLFRRRLVLTVQGERVVGWRGEGRGIDQKLVRTIAIPRTEPSVFQALLEGTEYWRGPLPPMPRNQEVVLALGDPAPSECLVLPIRVRSKTVAFLYGDALDQPLGAVGMAALKRLLAKTDLAFQVYLLKNKIRTL